MGILLRIQSHNSEGGNFRLTCNTDTASWEPQKQLTPQGLGHDVATTNSEHMAPLSQQLKQLLALFSPSRSRMEEAYSLTHPEA